MYTVSVKRNFIAQHYLIGGDWGKENQLNSHHYQIEVIISGIKLDNNGFLVDVVDIECNLNRIVDRYKDKTLNDFPEFSGLNPSIEHFSRIACESLVKHVRTVGLSTITVKIYEDEYVSSSYQFKL